MTFLNTRAPSGHRVCLHLRCKEMYYTSNLIGPRSRALVTDEEGDTHLYWCAKTCRARGPEGAVTLDSCSPERACYEA